MSENPSVHRAAAEGFASGAETYARGRPDYPPQALDWLRNELGLGAGRTVVELGAGTGKFTKVLLGTGATVIAVEPVMPMLERLRRDLQASTRSTVAADGTPTAPDRTATGAGRAADAAGGVADAVGRAADSAGRAADAAGGVAGTVGRAADGVDRATERLRALAGTAENIPVASGVADAVVCAQSFHWFATAATVAEIRRVLKPGGAFGLIWNQRDESVGWIAELGKLFERYQGDAPRMTSGEWRKLFPAPGFGPLHEVHFAHAHIGPPERVIVDRALSVSFMAALPAAERERVAAEIRALIARTPALAGRSEVAVPYVTMAFHCRAIASDAPA